MRGSVDKQHKWFVNALRKSMFPKKKNRDNDSIFNLLDDTFDSDDMLDIQAELEKKFNELFGDDCDND